MTALRYIASAWCALSGGFALALLLKLAMVWVAFRINAPVNLQDAPAVVLAGTIALAIGLFVIIRPRGGRENK